MNIPLSLKSSTICVATVLGLSVVLTTPAMSNDFDDLLTYDAVSDAVDLADDAYRDSRRRYRRYDRRPQGYQAQPRYRHPRSHSHRGRHGRTHHRRR